MTYEDQFKINKLVDFYRDRGYVNLVHDWEKAITKVADLPDLRYLADRAEHLYYNQTR